jgi:hypothetical protein
LEKEKLKNLNSSLVWLSNVCADCILKNEIKLAQLYNLSMMEDFDGDDNIAVTITYF